MTKGKHAGFKKFSDSELERTWPLPVDKLSSLIDDKNVNKLKEMGGIDGLAKSLSSNISKGIHDDDETHASRVAKYGRNELPEPPQTSLLELMWDALHDPTLVILIIAACVSLPVGVFFEDPSTGWIEGTAILVSVAIVVLVASINDYQKEKQFRELNRKKQDINIKVIRSGEQRNISIHDLVVGDVVMLETGDSVPCDGVLFKSSGLKINESALTGESDEVAKNPNTAPFCIASTQVSDGMGSMLAVAVGVHSVKGRITDLMNDDSAAEETLLQKKLTHIAELIGKFGFAVASFTVIVLVAGYLIDDKGVQGNPFTVKDIPIILDFFITGLTIVVVAVPEGLPLAVTISMAFSVKKMLKDNNLVRHLDACEVMGGATTICSDKTGTLTRNKMTVVRAMLADNQLIRSNERSLAQALKGVLSTPAIQPLIECILYNSTARISFDKPTEPGVRQDTGSKTECALLELAKDLGSVKEEVVSADFEYAHMHTFSSTRKRMTAVIKLENGDYRVLTKGASEVVLGLCTSMLQSDGTVTKLTEEKKEAIVSNTITKYASQALRTICLAYRDLKDTDKSKLPQHELIETDLTFIAIVGIEDPVRPEVPAAVAQCHRAGIVVRMVTGDNLETAQAIAIQCNIISNTGDALGSGVVMEGPQFRQMVLENPADPKRINMEQFRTLVPKLRVLARSSPADKFVLVRGLKEMGEVVAVTGDGTNDAPALRQANVGLSMGIQGTEVAKEASDIILMDDNFNSIVSAVKWGRNVFDSISKFVQFQITVNIVAIITAVVGAFTFHESPLTAVQLLWVNLIMDTLASLALATENPTEALLERPPYNPKRPIISANMWRNIFGQAVYQLAVLMTMIFAGHRLFNLGEFGAHQDHPTVHFTMVFNTFVMLQLFNEINSRKIHGEINVFEGFFSNHWFTGIVFTTLIVQFLIIQFGGLPMRTTPLTLEQWGICLAFGSGSLVVGVLLHIIPPSIFPEVGKGEDVHVSSHPSIRGLRRRATSMDVVRRYGSRSQSMENTDRNVLRSIVAKY